LVEERGSVIMGRRSYDNSIAAWGGKGPLGEVPCFVVTHRSPASPDPIFTFVTEGIEAALAEAKEVAAEKRIGLMGADIDQQFLAAGLVDEIRIHLIDVLLGGGRRLFDLLPQRIELEQTGLSQTDGVTHLEYRVLRWRSRRRTRCRPVVSIGRAAISSGTRCDVVDDVLGVAPDARQKSG
jgi:dihydrofolate reductase